MDIIRNYLAQNPLLLSLVFVLFGAFILLASVYNWDWIFGNTVQSNYNLNKLDGLINVFGRKTARIIFGSFGIFIIFGGLIWFLILIIE